MYHYLISDNKFNIINVCKLATSEKISIKRKIYKQNKSIKTNRTISMIENKIIAEMNIDDIYNVIDLSNKCKLLYNNQITILEMNGYNTEIAIEIFSLISNNDEELIFVDIDDSRIKND